MKDLFDSLVRTYVPWFAGVLIGWLISLGVPLDPEVEVQITLALMGGASLIYYFLARVFETHVHPKLGWLIGLPKQPLYDALSKDEILAAHTDLDPVEREADEQAAIGRLLRRDLR